MAAVEGVGRLLDVFQSETHCCEMKQLGERRFGVTLMSHRDVALAQYLPRSVQTFQEVMRPGVELLLSIVRDVLGRDASPQRVWRCAASITGQCFFYQRASPVLMRLAPDQPFTSEALEPLVDHIAQFSLAALRQFARAQEGELR